MANDKSTEKRIRQNEKSRKRNSEEKSAIRTAAKKVSKSITSSDSQETKDNFKQFVKRIDTAARKGIIHKRTAARKKSRIAKRINASAIKSN